MIEADSDLLTAEDSRDEIQQQVVGAVISDRLHRQRVPGE